MCPGLTPSHSQFDDDFYVCLSHVAALGTKCSRLRLGSASGGAPPDELTGAWRVDVLGPEPMQRCAVCARSAGKLLRCSACKSACYCCKVHQLVHWPVHRLACKKQA